MAFWPKKADANQPPLQPAPELQAAAAAAPAGNIPAPPVQSAQPTQPASSGPALAPEAMKNAAAASKAVMAAFGEIVTVLMRTQEHRGKMLSDLEWLVVPAVTTGQFALAEAQSKTNGMMAPVGLILWASVSADVDQRLRANLASGLTLKPDEWKSGDILWVIEAVGDPKILQAMLQRTSQNEWRGRPANLRIRDKDGSVKAGVLSQKPAQPAA
jgi:cytolysin-activating lysine-acyltransferase